MKTTTIRIDKKGKPLHDSYKVDKCSTVVFDCPDEFTIEASSNLFSNNPHSLKREGNWTERATVGDMTGTYPYKIKLTKQPNQTDLAFEDTPPTIIVKDSGPIIGFIHFIWRQFRRFLAYLKGLRFFR